MLSCENIHMYIKENETESEKDAYYEKAEQKIDHGKSEKNFKAKTCQCGKQVKTETFKCEKCEIFYCNSCPTGPIEDNSQCLPCLFTDYSILTSTPEKNVGTLSGPAKWTA